MGIDVFGRGTYAGGQLSCNVAAAATQTAGAAHASHFLALHPAMASLSCHLRPPMQPCISARGWVLWALHQTTGCPLPGLSVALFAPGWVYEGGGGNSHADWRCLDEQLWGSLAAVLGAGRPIARLLPFTTTFDVGAGRATWHEVLAVSPVQEPRAIACHVCWELSMLSYSCRASE